MESNYETQAINAKHIFQKFDQEVMIKKFELSYNEEYLNVIFLGSDYRIDRKTGEVFYQEQGMNGAYRPCHDFNIVMTIYDMLCHSKGQPKLSGAWCQLSSLNKTLGGPSAGNLFDHHTKAFTGHVPELEHACKLLGGIAAPVTRGTDLSYEIQLFPWFSVIFQFWDQDEEFPAKTLILWDKNSMEFMHFETLYYAAGHLLSKLQNLIVK